MFDYLKRGPAFYRGVVTLAVPIILQNLITTSLGLIDTFMVGALGEAPLAAVLVANIPVFVIQLVIFGLQSGSSVLISQFWGKGDTESINRVIGLGCYVAGAISLAFASVMFFLPEQLMGLLTDNQELVPLAAQYARIVGFSYIFNSLTGVYVGAHRSMENPKLGMIIFGASMLTNAFLNWVFIFGNLGAPALGVVGAAAATVISQLCSCVYVLRFLFSKKVPIPISFGGYRPRLMGRILLTGMTPFLIIAVDNVMIIAMNAVLQRYGGAELGDRLITCATIAQSFMLVVTMPLGGISAGTQTILAFNYGARNRERIVQAQKYIVLMCVGYVTVLFVLARLAGPLFVRLFTADAALAAEAFDAIKICTLAIIPLGVQYALVDGFTGMGLVQLSLPLSTFRKVVYFVALFALPAAFGARSVFYAEPVSDILGPLMSVAVYLLTIRKILSFPPREAAGNGKEPV